MEPNRTRWIPYTQITQTDKGTITRNIWVCGKCGLQVYDEGKVSICPRCEMDMENGMDKEGAS